MMGNRIVRLAYQGKIKPWLETLWAKQRVEVNKFMFFGSYNLAYA
jgi:hypothetical protein